MLLLSNWLIAGLIPGCALLACWCRLCIWYSNQELHNEGFIGDKKRGIKALNQSGGGRLEGNPWS